MFRRKRKLDDFAAEIDAHLEHEIARLREQGLTEEEACTTARREFGNITRASEDFYESHRCLWLDHLAQDIRFGLRMLRKSPGFTAVAVFTLALGIGANTAIFSVVNAVVLDPLPFKDSNRVVTVWSNLPARDLPNGTTSLESAADYEPGSVNLSGVAIPERIPAAEVSESFFRVFELEPILGRTFSSADEKPGHDPVAMLGEQLWKTRYHADPAILTKTIYLNGKGFTPIGIVPDSFDFPEHAQLWLPVPSTVAEDVFGGNTFVLFQIARLRSNATIAEARAEMEVIRKNELPKADSTTPMTVRTLRDSLAGDARPAALMLFGAVGFVLLIACADVANLLLARGATRTREVAVRRALGATRPRLIRQFLSESVLLSLAGGGLGLMLGSWSLVAFRSLVPARRAFAAPLSLDSRVLAFTFVLSICTGIIAGIVPALQSSKFELSEVLKEGARSSQEGFRFASHRGIRSLFGICEIALALILVVGASLFLRSFARLVDVSPGFQTKNVLVVRLSLLGPKYAKEQQRAVFLQQIVARTRTLPGVENTAVVNDVPLDAQILMGMNVQTVDSQKAALSTPFGALYLNVSPDYFGAMRIPVLMGRDFSLTDANPKTPVAIVSQSLADQLWPHRNPLGHHFTLEGSSASDPPIEVVGVVGDVREIGLDSEPVAATYFPAAEQPPNELSLVVRTDRNPLAMAGAVRSVIAAVDPDEPVSSFGTADEILANSVAQPRFRSFLIAVFGALALLLAWVGVYSVISYTVAQRTHEIGVRVALGAARRDILELVAAYGIRLAIAGLAVGLAGAYVLARFTATLLYGVRPSDPAAFVLGPVVLTIVVVAATYLPARRAMRMDPMVALRHE